MAIQLKAEIARCEKKIIELQENRKTATEAEKENIDRNINEQQDQINEPEKENEEIEGRMSLRDRSKVIFKKHGFTLTAVVVSVSVVISFLATNLKKGLTTLGSKFGGALKDLGRKLGQILPGLVGAIASFIFKTAGEAIGFLAKNAWLLQSNQVKRFAQESRFGFVLFPGRPPALRPLRLLHTSDVSTSAIAIASARTFSLEHKRRKQGGLYLALTIALTFCGFTLEEF